MSPEKTNIIQISIPIARTRTGLSNIYSNPPGSRISMSTSGTEIFKFDLDNLNKDKASENYCKLPKLRANQNLRVIPTDKGYNQYCPTSNSFYTSLMMDLTSQGVSSKQL